MEKLLKNKKALIIAIVAIVAVVGIVIGVSSMGDVDSDSNSPVVDSVGKDEKEQSIEEKAPTKTSAPIIGGFEYTNTLNATTFEYVTPTAPYVNNLRFFADGTGIVSWKTESSFLPLDGVWELDERNSTDEMQVYTFATETEGTAIIYYYVDSDECSVIDSNKNEISSFKRYTFDN